MQIKINCPECSKTIALPESAVGRKVRCPHCKAVFVGPSPEPASAAAPEEATVRGTATVRDPARLPDAAREADAARAPRAEHRSEAPRRARREACSEDDDRPPRARRRDDDEEGRAVRPRRGDVAEPAAGGAAPERLTKRRLLRLRFCLVLAGSVFLLQVLLTTALDFWGLSYLPESMRGQAQGGLVTAAFWRFMLVGLPALTLLLGAYYVGKLQAWGSVLVAVIADLVVSLIGVGITVIGIINYYGALFTLRNLRGRPGVLNIDVDGFATVGLINFGAWGLTLLVGFTTGIFCLFLMCKADVREAFRKGAMPRRLSLEWRE